MSSIHNKSNVEGKENIRFEICIINFIPENINLGILKNAWFGIVQESQF